jgi:hypothetical protein
VGGLVSGVHHKGISKQKHCDNAAATALIRTARKLGAEWRQVCGEAWVRGKRKMSQVLGVFGLLHFTVLWPVLAWHAFLNVWTVCFCSFSKFFWGGTSQTRITETVDTLSMDMVVHLYYVVAEYINNNSAVINLILLSTTLKSSSYPTSQHPPPEDHLHFVMSFKMCDFFNYKFYKSFKPHFQCTLHLTVPPSWCKTRYHP